MRSMTGFGKVKYEVNERVYTVEIKSVNYRYCDVSIKLPRSLSSYENEIKKMISSKVGRGKIDVFIDYSNFSNEGKDLSINKELAKLYISQLRELANETGLVDDIKIIDVSKMPDVLQLQHSDGENEVILNELKDAVSKTLDVFIDMREIEGNKIKIDLENRLDRIKVLVADISKNTTGLIEDYVVKLRERIQDILKTDVIDETRLAQETVIYADKCSIQEELTRLDSHIHQFEMIINSDETIGKKLDFVIQEMNREANTIASKSVKLEITNLVIEIKTVLEDIREQIQNIE